MHLAPATLRYASQHTGRCEHLYSPDQFGPGDGGSLFAADQVLFRAEMRAGWTVKRPAGVVELD